MRQQGAKSVQARRAIVRGFVPVSQATNLIVRWPSFLGTLFATSTKLYRSVGYLMAGCCASDDAGGFRDEFGGGQCGNGAVFAAVLVAICGGSQSGLNCPTCDPYSLRSEWMPFMDATPRVGSVPPSKPEFSSRRIRFRVRHRVFYFSGNRDRTASKRNGKSASQVH